MDDCWCWLGFDILLLLDRSTIDSLFQQIESKKVELEQAQRRGDLEAAARIQYGDMRELEAKLAQGEAAIGARQAE